MENILNEPIETYNQTGLEISNYQASKKLYPILKWAGGKEQELKYIIPRLPENFSNYYEPFVGGGAVYTALQANEYFINDKSEEFVLEYEIDRLIETLAIDRTLAIQNVQHLSRLQGDGLGYDISSINDDGSPRYIEVKTTSGGFNQPFYMSKNEKHFFEEYEDSAFIYRVYNFNRETRRGDVRIITQTELFSDFTFDTITWQVRPK
jgi:hypothetical protein